MQIDAKNRFETLPYYTNKWMTWIEFETELHSKKKRFSFCIVLHIILKIYISPDNFLMLAEKEKHDGSGGSRVTAKMQKKKTLEPL